MPKVLILGAGASHGHAAVGRNRPPLVRGFFDCPTSNALKDHYSTLFEYLRETIGDGPLDWAQISIEDVFGQVEPLWQLGLFKQNTEDRSQAEILEKANTPFNERFEMVSPLDMLRAYVVDMIYLSTEWLQNEECPAHRKIASKWIAPGDTIISFNYDIIIDTSLVANTSWEETTGYGWKARPKEGDVGSATFGGDLNRAISDYVMEPTEPEIRLLKPHGSINFWRHKRSRNVEKLGYLPIIGTGIKESDKYERKLVESIAVSSVRRIWKELTPFFWVDFEERARGMYAAEAKEALRILLYGGRKDDLYNQGNKFPVFIMPTPYKSFSDMTFGEMGIVWRHAFRSLQAADEVISCGFSFADQHFNQLLFHALRTRTRKLPMTLVTNSEQDFNDTAVRLTNHNIDLTPFVDGFQQYAESL